MSTGLKKKKTWPVANSEEIGKTRNPLHITFDENNTRQGQNTKRWALNRNATKQANRAKNEQEYEEAQARKSQAKRNRSNGWEDEYKRLSNKKK